MFPGAGESRPSAPRAFPTPRSASRTYIFTDYLSKVSPAWRTTVGRCTSVAWPVGVAGNGNEGSQTSSSTRRTHLARAADCIDKAVATMDGFDVPLACLAAADAGET
jgi:pantothenate kinase